MASLDFNFAITTEIENAIDETLKECGIKTVAEIKANAPVDSGKLRRSYKGILEQNGSTFTLTIGTNVDYSIFVEFKPQSRGGRPHFRRSFNGLENEITEKLKARLGMI